MGYKNCEGYSDPTAGAAISATAKEEQEVEKLNHKVIQSFRLLVDLAGFEIVGRVTLKHKKTGKNIQVVVGGNCWVTVSVTVETLDL